ncbi:hypothetical protein [Chitinophaga tropicalis]|uniref:Uncharacterized protein n=1 Tax=Chitinophaga tropicalis TaxID=2683588 RepID=A0A7K1UCT9_9BACT|nr:hypothetical protein [Chitinophaga tropicalis]MVT12136.1 hypothetical protein [Chitinophaga tropicalis]
MANFYDEIRLSVEGNFAFLRRYGFGDFEEQQIAYEVHFLAKNDLITINIWFEMTIETPVWVTVNGYYTSMLEPDNALDKQYTAQRAEIYANRSAREQFITLNKAYLQETASLLQKYPEVLMGDVTILKANSDKATAERERQQAAERIEKHIYTCYFTIGGGIECEEEAPSLEALRLSLQQFENPTIRIIEVVDCYMNPVPFPWP